MKSITMQEFADLYGLYIAKNEDGSAVCCFENKPAMKINGYNGKGYWWDNKCSGVFPLQINPFVTDSEAHNWNLQKREAKLRQSTTGMVMYTTFFCSCVKMPTNLPGSLILRLGTEKNTVKPMRKQTMIWKTRAGFWYGSGFQLERVHIQKLDLEPV